MVVGLAADGDVSLPDLDLAEGPLVIVVGSEGKGLSRLVAETCDQLVSIPMASTLESLNAGVAASVTLYAVAQKRAASSSGADRRAGAGAGSAARPRLRARLAGRGGPDVGCCCSRTPARRRSWPATTPWSRRPSTARSGSTWVPTCRTSGSPSDGRIGVVVELGKTTATSGAELAQRYAAIAAHPEAEEQRITRGGRPGWP